MTSTDYYTTTTTTTIPDEEAVDTQEYSSHNDSIAVDVSPSSSSTTTIPSSSSFHPKFSCDIIGTQTREEDNDKYTIYEIRVTPITHDGDGESHITTTTTALDMNNSPPPPQPSSSSSSGEIELKESFDHPVSSNAHYVFRRFNEFVKLHEQVTSHYPEFAEECPLPPSSWFFTFSEETIKLRREKFNSMLHLLMNTEKYFELPEVTRFIQHDLDMLQKTLSFFRAKLYHYRQQKDHEMTDSSKHKLEKAQSMVKILNKTVRTESFKKLQQTLHTPAVEEKQDETIIRM